MAGVTLRSVLTSVLRPGPYQDHAPLPESKGAGRNLPAAVVTGTVLVAAVALTLIFSPPSFVVLTGLACLAAVWEMGGAFARVDVRVQVIPLYTGVVALIAIAWFWDDHVVLTALYAVTVLIIAFRLFSGSLNNALKDIVASVFVLIYVPFFASTVILMLGSERGALLVGLFILVTCANDLGGWGVGVLVGRHPMIPRISPGKSWEGFAGSVLMCILCAIGALLFLDATWWWGILLGVFTATMATVGDLTESAVKRQVGLKDMSNLLPGHGGILDRLDSLLMTAPAFFFISSLALGE